MTNSWKIHRSILFELDSVFTFLYDYLPRASLSSSINQLLDSIPIEMSDELQRLLGPDKLYFNLLFQAGWTVQMEYEDDYASATLPIRQMNIEEFIKLTLSRIQENGIEVSKNAMEPPVERMKHICKEMGLLSYQRLGYSVESSKKMTVSLESDIERLSRVLAGGDLHAQFWHWLDRFYYQIYQPWRQSRINQMEMEEAKARMSLGVSINHLVLDWLPRESPLRNSPELIKALENQTLQVVFLIEPFNLPDTWFALLDGLTVTITDNQESHAQFYGFVNHLSERLKGLADPTRLLIMRIVRSSSRDNTEIASFLNISRPTVSIHAKQLREAGLIETFEEGRSVRHEVVASEVRALFHDLERFLDLPPEESEKENQKNQ